MTRMVKGSFHIGSITGVCRATGAPLAPGTRFVAALVEHSDSDELERMDFAAEAWDAGARPPRPELIFATWRSVVPTPDQRRRVLIDDAALVEIFEQLAGTTDPKRMAFRFVLALILIRKRLLVMESTKASVMMVRPKGSKPGDGTEAMPVCDPGLDESAIAEVTEQLTAIMAGDVSSAESAPPPAQATAGADAASASSILEPKP